MDVKNFRFVVAAGVIALMVAWGAATMLRSSPRVPATSMAAEPSVPYSPKAAQVSAAQPMRAPASAHGEPGAPFVDPDVKAFHFSAPPGRYKDALPTLMERAHSGDAEAAYILSRLLLDCYELQVKGNNVSDYGSREEDRCDGIPAPDPKEAIKWMEVAANKGLVDAELLFPTAAMGNISHTDAIRDPAHVQATKEESISLLAHAAAQGSANAMMQLSNAYARGILAEKNLPLAYAYLYAANTLHPEWRGDDPIDLYEGGLSADQVAKAKLDSENLLSQCCR